MAILDRLRDAWWSGVKDAGMEGEDVVVTVRGLAPEEAIGSPSRRDYPLLQGEEIMVQAELKGCRGQAFTDSPSNYRGRLDELNGLYGSSNSERALLVSTINATYRCMGIVSGTVHCRDQGPELCADAMAKRMSELHGDGTRLLMIGLQPALAQELSYRFPMLRVTDLNPRNFGRLVGRAIVEPGSNNPDAIDWADAILVTGSTIVNGTIDGIIERADGKPTAFYGVTIAAAAAELGLDRLCFHST